MTKILLTTREAALLLGVGTTSVKRWADTGLLECVKTPGGHRRFPRIAVEAMAASEDVQRARVVNDGMDRWMVQLNADADLSDLAAMMRDAQSAAGSWWRFCDDMGAIIEAVGRRWASGVISVVEEHIASERIARALSQLAEGIAVAEDAPTCLMLAAEGDDHTLGLSLAELCLRELGWRTVVSGRRTPLYLIESHLATAGVQMVAVSASVCSSDAASLADQARRLGEACAVHDAALLLGGKGTWPDRPSYGHRVYRCADIAALGAAIAPPNASASS